MTFFWFFMRVGRRGFYGIDTEFRDYGEDMKEGEILDGIILIADDDININKLFKYYLKTVFQGTVLSAFDGEDALNKCLSNSPDLIFLDINMPIMDGITVIKELRAKNFSAPIIVITAYDTHLSQECHEAGADIVISKPVTRQKFINSLYKFIPTYSDPIIHCSPT
ncbi:MAG: response regulator [Candidatus Marinimicrobia bacterium]|nr:response regulator [Candidatus Neomarinimicrobiota bacterium]